jgi:hypothetical protein
LIGKTTVRAGWWIGKSHRYFIDSHMYLCNLSNACIVEAGGSAKPRFFLRCEGNIGEDKIKKIQNSMGEGYAARGYLASQLEEPPTLGPPTK